MEDSSLETRVRLLEDRVSALEAAGLPVRASSNSSGKGKSPKEYLIDKSPRTSTEKVLCLGYYHETVLGQGSFNISDLEALFRASKEKLPTNMSDMANKNVKKGYIMEDSAKKDDKKAWVLTNTGEKYVENGFGEVN